MKDLIFEASYPEGSIGKIIKLYISLLEKKTKLKIYKPKIAFILNLTKNLKGMKFLVEGKKAFRFNWQNNKIASVSYWKKPAFDPHYTIDVSDLNSNQIIALLSSVFLGEKIKDRPFLENINNDNKKFSSVVNAYFESSDRNKQRELFEKFIDEVDYSGKTKNEIKDLWINYAKSRGIANPMTSIVWTSSSLRNRIQVGSKQIDLSSEVSAEQEEFLSSIGLKPGQKQSGASVFKQIEEYTKEVIQSKKARGLIVAGQPGLGKTFEARAMLKEYLGPKGDEWVEEGGEMSTIALYNYLYNNNGKIILFDDLTGPLDDKASRDILKKALDSNEPRTVSYNKMNVGKGELEDLPTSFDFTGKIIFITNKKFSDIDNALKSRCKTVNVDFTAEQSLQRVESKIENFLPEVPMKIKREVIDYLKEMAEKKAFEGKIDFRKVEDSVSTWLCTGVPLQERKQWIYFSLKESQ